ncbi:MAG: D-alanine--D-alanine ligase [Phycisphaerales bacterium]|jgi:D-alanine-D-alanine ligase|nr:D-alanine--D-alanine ligase [Phycisphaerales bacterium]
MSAPIVSVLMGGPDGEREVSIASGTAVAAALREAGWHVHDVVIDQPDQEAITRLPGDVLVPVLHGPWGEGGPLQRLLTADGRPFVGAGPEAAALCMDKHTLKTLAADIGIETPPWTVLTEARAVSIDPPVVVKPVAEGSSLGLSMCHSESDTAAAVDALIRLRGAAMVEKRVDGRELTVGVVDGVALPVIEISPATPFYDYDAKYLRDDTTYTVDPQLSDSLRAGLAERSLRLCQAADVTDLARVDFVLDQHGPWMLEVNTMPGFTSHSLLPMAAAAAGWSLAALCDRLVRAALN